MSVGGLLAHILVDCDPGLDDAIALLMLGQLHREGEIVMDLITTVAGNSSVSNSTSNARYILQAAGLASVAVVAGAGAPLGHTSSFVDGAAFHGVDGLAGLTPEPAESEDGADAASGIVSWAESRVSSGKRWMLCTGPLTNLALALQLEPGLGKGVDRVVIMGGAFGSPAGNIRPWAEFNFFADPKAAAIVCESDLPIQLVPLDVTQQLLVQHSQIDRLSGTLPGRILSASMDYTRRSIGVDGCFLHDPMAAAVLVAPTLVHMDAVTLTVDDSGAQPGRVHVRRGGSKMQRATAVDALATWSFIVNVLERSLPHLD